MHVTDGSLHVTFVPQLIFEFNNFEVSTIFVIINGETDQLLSTVISDCEWYMCCGIVM